MLSIQGPDFVPVADAIYDVEASSSTWFGNVYRSASKSLPALAGVMGFGGMQPDGVFEADDLSAPTFLGWGSEPSVYRGAVDYAQHQSPSYFRARTQWPAISEHQLFGDAMESLPYARWMRRQGFADGFALNSVASDGTFAAASFMLPERCGALPRGLVAEWECVARHLAIGAKLRRRPLAPDAVVRLDGALVDGTPRASADRTILRDLVRRLMRSRGSYRDRDNALASRRGGHWILVDRFESDGRHVILAYTESRPTVPLSKRERRVAELLARGCSHKRIADQLDVSIGTVASYAHRIFKKLNVQGRVELARALAR